MIAVVLLIGSLLLTYFIVRKGVHHGILDADESRRAYDRRQRLKDALAHSAGDTDPSTDS